MAHSQQPVDQQVTSQTPATKQKRVATGKAIAQKTKQAREAQKKALIEAQSIIANNHAKQSDPPPVSEPVDEPPPVESTKNVLTTTQWLSVIGHRLITSHRLKEEKRESQRWIRLSPVLIYGYIKTFLIYWFAFYGAYRLFWISTFISSGSKRRRKILVESSL